MRTIFPGYFRPKDEELSTLWGECIFAVDANVLLNLYRYSSATRNELETALKTIADRVYIPHQAAKEFLKNRLNVTAGQAGEYIKAIKTIDDLLNTLSSKDRHPFLSDDQLPAFQKYSKELVENLEGQQKALLMKFDDDEILSFVETLFHERTGISFDDDKMVEIAKEGEVRYSQDIPPGYKDGKKDGSGDPNRKFGDLIVWKQIIEYSISQNKSLIFITDDKKEDWWLEQSGRTIGPRPELIEEFIKETKQTFWMYSVDRFIQESAKIAKTTVSDDVIQEILKVSFESKSIENDDFPSITVRQETNKVYDGENSGLFIVTLNKSMRYATGTGKFLPRFARVPDFDIKLVSCPDEDYENIGISFGCGTVSNFNVHLKAKQRPLPPGDYVFTYSAVDPFIGE